MVLNAGRLDRRVQVRRFNENGRDPLNEPVGAWEDYGPLLYAERRDISDGEKTAAGALWAVLDTRFTVRSSVVTRAIKHNDRVLCEGQTYEIAGIKEAEGRKAFIEITCKALVV